MKYFSMISSEHVVLFFHFGDKGADRINHKGACQTPHFSRLPLDGLDATWKLTRLFRKTGALSRLVYPLFIALTPFLH